MRSLVSKPPIISHFQEYLKGEDAGGILLISCTITALVLANSPWASAYTELWNTKLILGLGESKIEKPLLLWINEGLMAVFFFFVGLEIKREVLIGELSSLKKALFPIVTAFGGMIIPAAIFTALNAGKSGSAGWGVPMATDIAFALGVLSLLGRRVPIVLKIFLTAVAIVDDLGAVLIIALFYSAEIAWLNLWIAGALLGLLVVINRIGVRNPLVYAIMGIGLWVVFLQSGIHATVAGVLLAMTIPASTPIDTQEFLYKSRSYLNAFERAGQPGHHILTNKEQRAALQALETASLLVEPPLQRLQHTLHPWVSFVVMPLFALANAGIDLRVDLLSSLLNPISVGIILGLFLGKQLGIASFAWIFSRVGFISKPDRISWRHLYGAGVLCGIGFTMSLFIANLAYGAMPMLPVAKIGILVGSLLSALTGGLILIGISPKNNRYENPSGAQFPVTGNDRWSRSSRGAAYESLT